MAIIYTNLDGFEVCISRVDCATTCMNSSRSEYDCKVDSNTHLKDITGVWGVQVDSRS